MPGPWDAVEERRLLLCIINPKATPKWDIIAGQMGEQFTGEACRQKYYKLKNESAKLAGRGASAPSTPLKPKASHFKVVKSLASTRVRKWGKGLDLITAEVSKPDEQPVAVFANPKMKAIANVPFYKVHEEETEVKPEDAYVKWEGSNGNYVP